MMNDGQYRGGPTTKVPNIWFRPPYKPTSNEAGPARPAFALLFEQLKDQIAAALMPYRRSDDKCWGAISGDPGICTEFVPYPQAFGRQAPRPTTSQSLQSSSIADHKRSPLILRYHSRRLAPMGCVSANP